MVGGPVVFATINAPTTLDAHRAEGGWVVTSPTFGPEWVLDHVSVDLTGAPSSVYYTRGAYGAGEVLRFSNHWAGDPGITSIDGNEWTVEGEPGTWRAGVATMAALQAGGCFHWIPEAAPFPKDLPGLRARNAAIEAALDAPTPSLRYIDKVRSLRRAIDDHAEALGYTFEELTA